MQSMTIQECRWWCCQESSSLKLTNEDILYYQNEEEPSFIVKHPSQFPRIAALAHDILLLTDASSFEGGLIWLDRWDIGAAALEKPGWRILEDMRRAHGDLRSLEIAPGELFRRDEFVELQAFLILVMAYGWSAYFVPSIGGYFLDFRTSERFFCKAKSPEKLKELFSALKPWEPLEEDPRTA
jgi:hypothetical protein